MTVRMLTVDLLSLLDDLVLTASGDGGEAGCAGILIYTARVDEGAEPGSTNALVGASTTGTMIGHCWTEAGGDLAPTLLPIQYVNALRPALEKLLNKDNKASHITEVRRDGEEVVITEDPDLFGNGFKQSFGAGSLDNWPRTVFAILATVYLNPPADARPLENRTDFPVTRLMPFLTIAKRHGGTFSQYRSHQALNVHIQIGTHYRGVLVPSGQWNDGSGDGGGPDIGVYPADLPPIETPEDAKATPVSV